MVVVKDTCSLYDMVVMKEMYMADNMFYFQEICSVHEMTIIKEICSSNGMVGVNNRRVLDEQSYIQGTCSTHDISVGLGNMQGKSFVMRCRKGTENISNHDT